MTSGSKVMAIGNLAGERNEESGSGLADCGSLAS